MTPNPKENIIPKEKAAFWLDKNGCWCNRHGKFEHKKIIDYFHASIRKDQNGYYVGQTIEGVREKVYFHYEDTALFVFDVIKGEQITLVLNTGEKMTLKPRELSLQADDLYVQVGEERIKFAEKALMKIAELIEDQDGQYVIRVKNRKYRIERE